MDTLDKYYAISEKFNDELIDVVIALRASGASQKPALIIRDLQELWISKYSASMDYLYDAVNDEKVLRVIKGYIINIHLLSRKYNFNPTHGTKIGSINTIQSSQPTQKEIVIVREHPSKQLCIFDFLER
jgi:hypothetical protein